MKLLVVDDSNVIRARIARIALNPALTGLTVVGLASNGRDAVEKAIRLHPDLVTMDLTMPELDGVQAISEMVAALPDINILVVSALADKVTAIEALKRGARGFLYKPFTDEQLVSALIEVSQ